MKIKMQLLSDAVFGNGMSVPGGEDISVLYDEFGFPYYKGGTFKGVFREELARYLVWTGKDEEAIERTVRKLLGKSGDDEEQTGKLVFSDFKLSSAVRGRILDEIGVGKEAEILDSLTNVRTFTSIDDTGMTKKGSLRNCRCVNEGLCFYSELNCLKEDEEMISEVLSLIKGVGTMRNRGFGKVKIEVVLQESGKCQCI